MWKMGKWRMGKVDAVARRCRYGNKTKEDWTEGKKAKNFKIK
jgi:hypothetical protein